MKAGDRVDRIMAQWEAGAADPVPRHDAPLASGALDGICVRCGSMLGKCFCGQPLKPRRGWVGLGKLGFPFDDVASVNIYCGRWDVSRVDRYLPPGWIHGELGNPYCGKTLSRAEKCAMFAAEFDAKESPRSLLWHDAVEWIFRQVRDGETVRLWCHCHPKQCHCGKLQHEAVLKSIFEETPETPYSWELGKDCSK